MLRASRQDEWPATRLRGHKDSRAERTVVEIERAITIDAPVEEVFDYWASPEHLMDWPNLVHVTDIQQLPNGGASYRWVYNLDGMRLDGTVEDVKVVTNQRKVSRIRGAIDILLTARFQSQSSGTKVMVETEYSVPIPVLGKVAEAFIIQGMTREIDSMLGNLKSRLEA
jgi:uncharacterized membrane protein